MGGGDCIARVYSSDSTTATARARGEEGGRRGEKRGGGERMTFFWLWKGSKGW